MQLASPAGRFTGVTWTGVLFRRLMAVPLAALRILGAHWAMLITVIALGLAGRQAVIWLAVVVSNDSPLLATLLMPLAPISVMAALIFALWQLRPSLPFVSQVLTTDPTKEGLRTRLITLGGLLIPFLTVYSSTGLLKADVRAFIADATVDESVNTLTTADYSRVFIQTPWIIALLVATALVLRKLIAVFALGERFLPVAFAGAYLEVLWMISLSVVLASRIEDVKSWALTRASVAPVVDAVTGVLDWATGLTGQAGTVVAAVIGFVAGIDDLVVVPIAWLTLGAAIYGTSVAASQADTAARAPGSTPVSSLTAAAKQRLEAEARTIVNDASFPIAGPIRTAWGSFKKVAAAGIAPVIGFCILFAFAELAELATVYLWRAVAGPHELMLSYALEPYAIALAKLVYYVVALALVAPAIDRVLRFTRADLAGRHRVTA